MFKWLKKVFGLRESGKNHSSKNSTICKNSSREEVVDWVDQGLQDLVQANSRKVENGSPVLLFPLSAQSPAPPVIRFSPRNSFPSPHAPPTSPPPPPPPPFIRNSPLEQPPPTTSPPAPSIQNSPLKPPPPASPPAPPIRNSQLKQPPSPASPPAPPIRNSRLQRPPPSASPLAPPIQNSTPKRSPLPPPSVLQIQNSPPKLSFSPPPPPTPPLFRYSPDVTHTGQNASSLVGQSLKVKAPSTDLPHESPGSQPSSQGKQPSPPFSTQTRLLSGTQTASRTPDTSTLLKVSPCEEIKVGQTDRQVKGSEVLGPKVHQKSYPSSLLANTLTNHAGELVTVKGTRYVRIKDKDEVVMVSLTTGPRGDDAPCRVLWQSGRPVPLVELRDSTCVNIDAFLSPGSERMQAVVIWQKEKPDTCLQLLDNTYIFLDSRGLTCQQKALNIFAKRLNITFDGKQVSAEVCNAVTFQDGNEITLEKFLQLSLDEFYATVFKMLEGTGHGRVVYVCTCLWIGRRPIINKLPMVVKKQNLYKKISYGLYSSSNSMRILYCDVNASLNLVKGTATIEVEVDGSFKSLDATHLVNLEVDKLKQHAAVQVSAHVMKEVSGEREKWSAVMIHLSNSTGTDVSPTWVAAGHSAPNTNKGGAQQNTSVLSPWKNNTQNKKETSISPMLGTSILSALKTNEPAGQKTSSIQSVPTIPPGKTQLKSVDPSHISFSSSAKEKNVWSSGLKSKYLTCSVVSSKPNAAVVMGDGKKILVTRSNLFANQVQVPSSTNLQSLLKKYQNLGVIFTKSREEFTDMNTTMKHVALVAWAGKKPHNADAIAQQRLCVMKMAPSQSPALPAALHAVVKVDASCSIMEVQNETVTVFVHSKHLSEGYGIAHAKLSNIYQDGMPINLTSAMNLKGQLWHCELLMKDGEKQLTVPLAWSGKKPTTDALPKISTSQTSHAHSTGDPNDTPNGHVLTPPFSYCQVVVGEVVEVLPEGGCVKAEDGRHFTFSIDVCFLYDLCLQHMKAQDVLVVGMSVEMEVTCSGGSESVRRVWLAGPSATVAPHASVEPKLDSWCSVNGVSRATQLTLMKETELLSPSLFPTAATAEATMIVDISA